MSAAAPTVTANFTIPPNHAALPGHFPGNQVVPGVVVLDHVIRVLEASGVPLTQLRKLKQVKFIEPLLPDQKATVTAEVGDAVLSFSVARGGRTIAKGAFEVGNEFSR
jgi:3-hydroxymyristoyl/3-hydroxydecanoyl-(acyl carrier protein) dehydratase